MRLQGHHAVVTGGGTGIGAAIARTLGAEGAKLTLVGRRRDRLEEVGRGDFDALVAPADVTDRAQVDRAFALARQAQGPITILVNNAGAGLSAKFDDLTMAMWRDTMAVNLDALFHCCQAALADLRAAESGRIVTVASTAGLKPYLYSSHYIAAKHGAIGLTRALALELARTNVTVNAVCPGFTDTEMSDQTVARAEAMSGRPASEIRAALEKLNPQHRMVTPQQVADAVLWLCLPASSAINGQAIPVAGGEVM